MKLWRVCVVLSGLTVLAGTAAAQSPAPQKAANPTGWKRIFDGESLEGWKSASYGGEGEVGAEEGNLVLNIGGSMTGATYQRPFPKSNYEVRCEAQRADGHDFFCGMTFPVADSHCSLIVGGWGGGVVGLSSINGHDASENETTKYMKFDDQRWYKFRVRVTPKRIQAWIDEKLEIDADIEGCKISTRIEVNLNKPFGFATYETKALIRNIELRELTAAEIAETGK